MKINASIAKKYANAIYRVAKKAHREHEILKNLLDISSKVRSNKVFRKTILSRCAPKKEQVIFINTLLAGKDYPELIHNAVNFLLRSRRLNLICDVAGCYKQIIDKHDGIEYVEVSTAFELSDELAAQAKSSVKSFLNLKKIEWKFSVEEDLIGGFTIKWHNKLLDLSFRNRQSKLLHTFEINE